MAYADYRFYREVFIGDKIPAESFCGYAERASDYIDMLCRSRPPDDALKKACCAVAEVLYADASGANISSESVGDYSVSFAASDDGTKPLRERVADAVRLYIGGVSWC